MGCAGGVLRRREVVTRADSDGSRPRRSGPHHSFHSYSAVHSATVPTSAPHHDKPIPGNSSPALSPGESPNKSAQSSSSRTDVQSELTSDYTGNSGHSVHAAVGAVSDELGGPSNVQTNAPPAPKQEGVTDSQEPDDVNAPPTETPISPPSPTTFPRGKGPVTLSGPALPPSVAEAAPSKSGQGGTGPSTPLECGRAGSDEAQPITIDSLITEDLSEKKIDLSTDAYRLSVLESGSKSEYFVSEMSRALSEVESHCTEPQQRQESRQISDERVSPHPPEGPHRPHPGPHGMKMQATEQQLNEVNNVSPHPPPADAPHAPHPTAHGLVEGEHPELHPAQDRARCRRPSADDVPAFPSAPWSGINPPHTVHPHPQAADGHVSPLRRPSVSPPRRPSVHWVGPDAHRQPSPRQRSDRVPPHPPGGPHEPHPTHHRAVVPHRNAEAPTAVDRFHGSRPGSSSPRLRIRVSRHKCPHPPEDSSDGEHPHGLMGASAPRPNARTSPHPSDGVEGGVPSLPHPTPLAVTPHSQHPSPPHGPPVPAEAPPSGGGLFECSPLYKDSAFKPGGGDRGRSTKSTSPEMRRPGTPKKKAIPPAVKSPSPSKPGEPVVKGCSQTQPQDLPTAKAVDTGQKRSDPAQTCATWPPVGLRPTISEKLITTSGRPSSPSVFSWLGKDYGQGSPSARRSSKEEQIRRLSAGDSPRNSRKIEGRHHSPRQSPPRGRPAHGLQSASGGQEHPLPSVERRQHPQARSGEHDMVVQHGEAPGDPAHRRSAGAHLQLRTMEHAIAGPPANGLREQSQEFVAPSIPAEHRIIVKGDLAHGPAGPREGSDGPRAEQNHEVTARTHGAEPEIHPQGHTHPHARGGEHRSGQPSEDLAPLPLPVNDHVRTNVRYGSHPEAHHPHPSGGHAAAGPHGEDGQSGLDLAEGTLQRTASGKALGLGGAEWQILRRSSGGLGSSTRSSRLSQSVVQPPENIHLFKIGGARAEDELGQSRSSQHHVFGSGAVEHSKRSVERARRTPTKGGASDAPVDSFVKGVSHHAYIHTGGHGDEGLDDADGTFAPWCKNCSGPEFHQSVGVARSGHAGRAQEGHGRMADELQTSGTSVTRDPVSAWASRCAGSVAHSVDINPGSVDIIPRPSTASVQCTQHCVTQSLDHNDHIRGAAQHTSPPAAHKFDLSVSTGSNATPHSCPTPDGRQPLHLRERGKAGQFGERQKERPGLGPLFARGLAGK
eukprot:Hpha_TRINITY_DN15936_c1_g1::TRINITY_DN15936_c1_g1_i1::g.75101::m.75101